MIKTQSYKVLFSSILPTYILKKEFSLSINYLPTDIPQNQFSLKVKNKSDLSLVPFTQSPTDEELFYSTSITAGYYILEYYHRTDPLPFYSKDFTVTYFDEARSWYNIAKDPFEINFYDMIGDYFVSTTPHTLNADGFREWLDCTYNQTKEITSCVFDTSDLALTLSKIVLRNPYNVILRSGGYFEVQFATIAFVECKGKTSKINPYNGECYRRCKQGENVYDYDDECLPKCPKRVDNINKYCVEEFEVEADNDNEIVIKGGTREQLEGLLFKYFDDFMTYQKTIVLDDCAFQLYEEDKPIQSEKFSILNSTNISKTLNLPGKIAIFKVDYKKPN